MRRVHPGGDACLTANQTCALLTTTLISRLASTAEWRATTRRAPPSRRRTTPGARSRRGSGRPDARLHRRRPVADDHRRQPRGGGVLGGWSPGPRLLRQRLHESAYVRVRPSAPPPSLGERNFRSPASTPGSSTRSRASSGPAPTSTDSEQPRPRGDGQRRRRPGWPTTSTSRSRSWRRSTPPRSRSRSTRSRDLATLSATPVAPRRASPTRATTTPTRSRRPANAPAHCSPEVGADDRRGRGHLGHRHRPDRWPRRCGVGHRRSRPGAVARPALPRSSPPSAPASPPAPRASSGCATTSRSSGRGPRSSCACRRGMRWGRSAESALRRTQHGSQNGS